MRKITSSVVPNPLETLRTNILISAKEHYIAGKEDRLPDPEKERISLTSIGSGTRGEIADAKATEAEVTVLSRVIGGAALREDLIKAGGFGGTIQRFERIVDSHLINRILLDPAAQELVSAVRGQDHTSTS